MVSHAASIRPRPSRVGLGLVLVAAVATLLAVRLTGVGATPGVQTFVLIFTSIAIEALPFVLLGAAVSAAIEVYVPARIFDAAGRLPVAVQLPTAAFGGLLFPVCECGSVPVARRLITRGLHPAAGLAFMLAAPILNPVVLASTVVAYAGRGLALEMVLGRAGLGLVIAIVAGWALAPKDASELLRTMRPSQHDHHTGSRRGFRDFVEHLSFDFFFMGRFVVLGAALAALLQTVVPQAQLASVGSNPILASLAMMAIAYALSLCSEADAFVAVSFTQFSLGSQLAFLVFGPAVDAKLSFLYGATFRRAFVPRLIAVTAPVALAGALWFEALVA